MDLTGWRRLLQASGGRTTASADVLRAQMDLMVKALSCGMTRVATLQCSDSLDSIIYNFIDSKISERHHTMTHEAWKASDARHVRNMDQIESINQWYGRQFKYLLDKLDDAPSGAADGSTPARSHDGRVALGDAPWHPSLLS